VSFFRRSLSFWRSVFWRGLIGLRGMKFWEYHFWPKLLISTVERKQCQHGLENHLLPPNRNQMLNQPEHTQADREFFRRIPLVVTNNIQLRCFSSGCCSITH
jgi:hypothetical protein